MEAIEQAQIADPESRSAWLLLECGPLAMYFDPATAALREIRLDGQETLQSIGGVVRDRNWGTVPPKVSSIRHERTAGGFRLAFSALCRSRDVDFEWTAEVTGQSDGTLHFHMEGVALSKFQRNRIGLCVLYPLSDLPGKRCIVEKVDGGKEEGVFPDAVSPTQPFRNLRSFRHEPLPGVWMEMRLEGDIFEMEDHRNWTDGNCKIYSTPLEIPFPVELPKGARIAQTATLRVFRPEGSLAVSSAPIRRAGPVILRFVDAPPVPMPRIGLGTASHGDPLNSREKERLKSLALSHLRVDVTPSGTDWLPKLRQAEDEARALGIQLEVAIFLSDDTEADLSDLAASLRQLQPPVVRWLVFQDNGNTATAETFLKTRQAHAPLIPDAEFGSGSNANFAELNRQRPPVDILDCVTYSINPQVHAFDRTSLVENLDGQAPTVHSARTFCGDTPIVVSPVTLKPRFNPYATGKEAEQEPGELPPQVDVRQSTLFAAAWTLGSLKALCECAVHSITYYETTGRRGIMETEAGSPLPTAFSSTPGAVFPMYHVFADVGEFKGGEALPIAVSEPRKVATLALQSAGRLALLCANLTEEPQTVRMNLPRHGPPTFRQMDAANLDPWLHSPEAARSVENSQSIRVTEGFAEWTLPPFAYARLDWKE